MGKYFLFGTIACIVIIVGMLIYPTVHLMISGVSVTGFTDLEKAGMVLLSYSFLFFMGYIVWKHIR